GDAWAKDRTAMDSVRTTPASWRPPRAASYPIGPTSHIARHGCPASLRSPRSQAVQPPHMWVTASRTGVAANFRRSREANMARRRARRAVARRAVKRRAVKKALVRRAVKKRAVKRAVARRAVKKRAVRRAVARRAVKKRAVRRAVARRAVKKRAVKRAVARRAVKRRLVKRA